MLILGFEDYLQPAQALADVLQAEYRSISLHTFPDGETRVKLPMPLPPDVILVRTLHDPNAKLVQLLIAAQAARENGAQRVFLVAPYLCYMRQDIAFTPGEAVSQKIIGQLLGEYFDGVITVDPHLHRIHALSDAIQKGQAISLTAASLMGEQIARLQDKPLLVGPDEESAQWVSKVAKPAGLDHVVATKVRHGDRNVVITLPEFGYAERKVLLVDDVISSGHTLMHCAELLHARGCKEVSAMCTHALLAPGAEDALKRAGITSVISTDSIPHASNRIPLAPLLADALKQLNLS